MKSDCPNESGPNRPFTGTCRVCEQEGHRAADCPTRPPQICVGCGEEGHKAQYCPSATRKIDRSKVEDMAKTDALKAIKAGADDCDMTDVKKVSLPLLLQSDRN